ncbi:hypothetical protein LTR65_005863 [Meristemomyces frigidus]
MAEGQKAAEETKGVVKGLGQVSEGLRKNINSFADNIVGGNKGTTTGTHGAYDETRDEARANRDIIGGSATSGLGHNTAGTGTGTSTATTGTSGDVHPDAKKLGSNIEQAL